MLNKLWPCFIIISFIYAIFNFNMNELNNSIFDSCKQTIEMILNFIGIMCMWNGIMEIVKETTLINKITKCLSPIMKFLFPELKKDNKAYKEISMNIIANFLGLGNAATPLGLKAIESLQQENKNKEELSNSMVMFIVLNTASIQIIPTTVIAIRASMGSTNPSSIIIPSYIASIIAVTIGILSVKILSKRGKK